MRMDFNGNIDKIIELPCTWPNSCTFGGRNMDVLFITSARFTITPTHLRKNPLEGSLLLVLSSVLEVFQQINLFYLNNRQLINFSSKKRDRYQIRQLCLDNLGLKSGLSGSLLLTIPSLLEFRLWPSQCVEVK